MANLTDAQKARQGLAYAIETDRILRGESRAQVAFRMKNEEARIRKARTAELAAAQGGLFGEEN